MNYQPLRLATDRVSRTNLDARPVTATAQARPYAAGKFLALRGNKFYIRGTTYGTFTPDDTGREYPPADQAEADFRAMAENGFNAVRLYTCPPPDLLEAAHRAGLKVMVSLLAEAYVGYLNDGDVAFDLRAAITEKLLPIAGHPAILCYALGNEIPASTVRWHGARKIESYLEQLSRIVRSIDPGALVTYVNYPTTEYLDLPFLDLLSFNVYLESPDQLRKYLARLQNLAGDRPLVMSEIGIDSIRHGEQAQAEALAWQIDESFASGCAGAFVFSWTDQWHRGGADVTDWAFGLTDAERKPKPALSAVSRAFADIPIGHDGAAPRISVVVCSYNGARTIRDCLDGLTKLDYPNFEVIVVDDGSTDGTGDIAREYGFNVIRTENRGLSSARNTGLHAATGEIVAYTDDDARPDPHWLSYLAHAYRTSEHVGIGGPNIAPDGDGPIAEAVANAPGGPVHVLLDDSTAEHIPGCNCSFRRDALMAIGGFDPLYRSAGDDVDVCWRLQENGGTLGFHPGAMVWHHARNSIRAYWRQQLGYGKAEALLEKKHPEKYNALGHLAWAGRLYGRGLTETLVKRTRIYQGVWGSAPFQSSSPVPPGMVGSLPLTPEWYLFILVLTVLAIGGILWTPLLSVIPVLLVSLGLIIGQAGLSAAKALTENRRAGATSYYLVDFALTALLHVIQPMARLIGRIRHGLTPWRLRGVARYSLPLPQKTTVWREAWVADHMRLQAIFDRIRSLGGVVMHGGEYDRWDIEVRGGLIGRFRLLMGCEDGRFGSQIVRISIWPRVSWRWIVLEFVALGVALAALLDGAVLVGIVLGLLAAVIPFRAVLEWSVAKAALLTVLKDLDMI